MEYTTDLTIFEGIVDAADDVISIAEIKEKAGNERRVDYLNGRIQEFLKEVEYLEDGQYKKEVYDKLRQLALFVIFSAELPVLEEMKEWAGLELIIGSLPTLPRYVMCEILWNLDIDEIIGEILIYSYPILALDVADSLIENFKYFVPGNCLEKLHMLTGSCYKLLYQLMFFNLNTNVVIRTYNKFMLCLKYFLEPPNSYKLDTLSEDDLYKYLGNRIYAFLGVLDECLNVFTRKGLQKLELNEIYLSTVQPHLVKRECVSLNYADKDCHINLVNEYLVKCNTALLDTCKSLLTDISIDIFCSWSEFEENGISLQKTIGDLGYKITTKFYQFVNNIEPVWIMLQLISSKPKDLKEEINKVDSKTIIENISKGTEESIEWLKALLHRDNLCSDYDLLREIYNQSNMMSNDESHKLYNILYDHLEGLEDNREFIKSLLIRCFENCMNEVKQELVKKHFCQNLNDTLTSEIFDSMMTKIFNKLISLPEADEIFEQIYDVFLQSPKKVFNKIFLLASESIQQAKIMVKVMMFLNRYSNHKYENENECCVLLMAKDTFDNDFDTEIQRDNFITFIEELKYTKVLAESKLLNFVIMPSILIGLTSNNINKLCLHCKLLQKAYTPTDIVQYRAPFLVMLAQVLETVRWRINTFTSMKPTVLDLVLDLVSSIFNTYESDISEKDKEWLKMKLKNLHPLNMYYYRSLWKPKGNSFIEIISGTHIHEKIHHERLVLWLTQQFCSTSLQEWFKMWDSLEIFKNTTILDLFHAAIMILVVTENNHRTEHSEACLLYCLRNYISIIKNKYLKPPLNDFAVKNIMNKLAALENLVSVNNIEEIKTIFLPLFSFIAERKEDYAVDTLVSLHNQFKHTEIKNACVRFFVNSNTDE